MTTRTRLGRLAAVALAMASALLLAGLLADEGLLGSRDRAGAPGAATSREPGVPPPGAARARAGGRFGRESVAPGTATHAASVAANGSAASATTAPGGDAAPVDTSTVPRLVGRAVVWHACEERGCAAGCDHVDPIPRARVTLLLVQREDGDDEERDGLDADAWARGLARMPVELRCTSVRGYGSSPIPGRGRIRQLAEAEAGPDGVFVVEAVRLAHSEEDPKTDRTLWLLVREPRGAPAACGHEEVSVYDDDRTKGEKKVGDIHPDRIFKLTVAAHASGGARVAGALVRLKCDSGDDELDVGGTTGSDGLFEIALPARLFFGHLSVAKPGSGTRSRELDTRRESDGGRADVRIQVDLEPEATLRGVVQDEQGRPIGGVSVSAWGCDRGIGLGRERAVAATNDEGRFEIATLVAGRYSLSATDDDPYHEEAYGAAEVEAPRDGVTIVLRAAGRISFAVRSPAGTARPTSPSIHASLLACGRPGGRFESTPAWTGEREAAPGADPSWTGWIDHVLPGTYRLAVVVESFPPVTSLPFQVQPGRDVDVPELPLARGRALLGRLVAPPGVWWHEVSPRASVALDGGAPVELTRLKLDAEGRFALEGFPEGEAMLGLAFHSPDLRPGLRERSVRVPAGAGHTELGDVVLERAPAEAPPK